MHRSLAPSLLLAALALSFFARSSEAGTCGCMDLADLKHRSEEVKIALDGFQSEITNLQGEMLKERRPIYYTPALAQKMRDSVQAALDRNAAGKLPTGASGNTDNLCNISVNERATACMQESARVHEQQHRDACLKTLSASAVVSSVSTPGGFKDRFERKHAPLISYAIEETVGYFAEKTFVSNQINSLEGPCKPPPPPQIERDYTSQPRKARRPASPDPVQQTKSLVDPVRRLFGK